MSDRTRKLISIRHHTDHDLQVLVSRELDQAFAMLDVVTTRTSPFFAQAVKRTRRRERFCLGLPI
jgi:hypothetical protein